MELPFVKNQTPKVVLQITLTLVILAIIPLYYPLLGSPHFFHKITSSSSSSSSTSEPEPSNSSSSSSSSSSPSQISREDLLKALESEKICDLFSGEWIPNPEAPYYTNTTCWAIHENQNCMKYGRPDTDFMKWRWKPDGCDLPIFNPAQFLEIVRGKSLAFIGDSMTTNQVQSLICLLSRVTLLNQFN
ncbi:hypothetical protein LWI28_027938 [Acer negundo]|uniref:Trichome birefringence-like N-terminal domain-containing protein n=1 Tax=Acer negundo TaxID=4023 RepID=A0AAD5NEV5_ACENE|nr:hypothetical protein LWI28_027938 [Acer negundo]